MLRYVYRLFIITAALALLTASSLAAEPAETADASGATKATGQEHAAAKSRDIAELAEEIERDRKFFRPKRILHKGEKLNDRQKILRMLRCIRECDTTLFTFEIDGKSYTPIRAAQLLESRWKYKEARTVREFIKGFATSSVINEAERLYYIKKSQRSEPLYIYLEDILEQINMDCISRENRDFVGEASFKIPLLIYIDKDFEQQEYDILCPLFKDRRDWKGNVYTALHPLFQWIENKDKEIWRLDFFYLLSSIGREKDTRHAYLLPLFYWEEDAGADRTQLDLFWPIIHRERKANEYFHFLIRPLISIEEDHRPYQDKTVPPRDADEFSMLWVPPLWNMPLFTYARDEGKTHSHLFPLYFYDYDAVKKKSEWQFLWPLTSFQSGPDESSSYIFPLSWWGSSKERSWFVGPLALMWYDHNPQTASSYFHFFPLYFGASTQMTANKSSWNAVLPPLIYWGSNEKEEYSRWDLLFPLVGHKSEKTFSSSWFFPLFYHCSDSNVADSYSFTWLAPTFFYREDKDESFFHFFPVYSHYSKKEPGSGRTLKTEHNILLLLFHSAWDEKTKTSYMHLFFPLICHNNEDGESYGWALPLAFWSRSFLKASGHTTMFPLYFNAYDKTGENTVLFPLYWNFTWDDKKKDKGYVTHVWPFYGTGHWEDDTGSYDQVSFLYPLFSFTTEERGTYANTRILYPLFSYTRDNVLQESSASFLWPLFSYGDDKRHYQHTLFPLYSYVHDKKEKSSSFWALWPLMSSSSDLFGEDFSILWELFRKKSVYKKSYELRFNPMFQYYETYDNGGAVAESSFSLFWFMLSSWSKGNDYSFRLFWELYKAQNDGEYFVHNFHPLWMYRSDRVKKQAGLDLLYLFFNYRGDAEKSTYTYRMLLKLWVMQQTEDSFSHEFNPLFQYQCGTEDGEEFMQFSTFWFLTRYRERGDDYTFRLLWRLFYASRRGDYRTLEFNPLFNWSDGKDEGTNFSLLYILWMSHVGEEELYHYLLGGLLGYEADETGGHLRLFWLLRL